MAVGMARACQNRLLVVICEHWDSNEARNILFVILLLSPLNIIEDHQILDLSDILRSMKPGKKTG